MTRQHVTSASLGDSRAPEASATRVLVVDDNVDAADSLAVLFQAYGYSVIKAYNGKDAIELALQHNRDLRVAALLFDARVGFGPARRRPSTARFIAADGKRLRPPG